LRGVFLSKFAPTRVN